MKRKIELQRRLRSLQTLRTAVNALKSISARHFRETRRDIEPANVYRDAVEQIAAWSGVHLAAGDGPAGMLVIGGELGLCGGYNSRIVAAAVDRRLERGPGPTLCVGHRSAAMLRRRRVDLTAVYAMPTSVDGITRALLPLAEAILGTYAGLGLKSLDAVSSVFTGVGSHVPHAIRMLPIAAPVSPDAPAVRFVPDDQLAAAAARELLYIRIYDLLLDAMACEHSARLVASQAAEGWLDQRRDQLERQLASTRREASTQEVLEIAAGARARRRQLPGQESNLLR